MESKGRRIVIIGGGIAGLCTAVLAQKLGYQAELLEMHSSLGGLATNWQRGGYSFETCIQWFVGSNPQGDLYSQWEEVFDINRLRFVHHREFARLESESGDSLPIYTDLDQLEQQLLKRTPHEEKQIRRFICSVRMLCSFRLPDPGKSWVGNWRVLLADTPLFPLFERLSRITSAEYGKRFSDPLLRAFFADGDIGRMSALALFFTLAWMHQRNADYPIGGSQAVIELIAENARALGAHLSCGVKVKKIIVEDDTAVGVELANGEMVAANWVVSAADGHTTIYDLLGGRYAGRHIDKIYQELTPFSSYVQVSLGVAGSFSEEPAYLVRLLDTPLQLDPRTRLSCLPFRIFHYDPTFAPQGKTVITCFLPSRDSEYWVNLHREDPGSYEAEKQRVAQEVIAVLGRRLDLTRNTVEVVDVSTPASVIKFTGNWKGSMEGWLLTPESGWHDLPNTLAHLDHFVMAGHWVMPGGGLPSGLMTAKSALRVICKNDRVLLRARSLAGFESALEVGTTESLAPGALLSRQPGMQFHRRNAR
jgi:phytoene dehydrogenase-like protein